MPVSQLASPQPLRELSGCALLIAVIMLFAAGKAVLHDTMDPDFFWHLRVADQLQTDGVGPLVDQISFASTRAPWTPYSWLGELGMKWIWDHAGLPGAIATQAVLQALIVLLIALCAAESGASKDSCTSLFSIVLSTAFATFLTMPFLSFRPVLVAIVLLALVTLLLLRDRRLEERTRAVWIVPALTAVIVNFHIFAVFVPAFVGALLAGAMWERDRAKMKRYAILLGLCVAGCCCTPMLPGTLSAIRDYATANPLTATSMIAELEPMYRGLSRQIPLAIVVLIVACAVAKRTVRAGELLWVLGMGLLWAKCGRGAPVFVPIFASIACRSIPALSDRALGTRWVNLGAAALVLIGTLRLCFSLPAGDKPDDWFNRRGDDLPGYPSAAAEFVQARVPRATGKLINEFDWGGYLAWKLPTHQVLLDGRTQLYTPQFWRSAYLETQGETTRLLSTIPADAAILPAGKSRFRDSLESLGWKRIFRDARADVLVPPDSMARTTE